MFRTVTSSAFGADVEDVSSEALVSAPQKAQVVVIGFRTPQKAQIAGTSQAVCLLGGPESSAFKAGCEDV